MGKVKYIIIFCIIIALAAGIGIGYRFTQKFDDTTNMRAVYLVNALDLIKEFQRNNSIANIKYAEKIITVTGLVTQVENANYSINIKMSDTVNGSYVIFAFQDKNLNEAKSIKTGDKIAIKGSCSGGAYSKILAAEFITFKRCVLDK